ncbi:MAG: cytochrome c biogenesis protein CcdA [Candidatus Delongbacteria bacterium]
MRYFLAAIVFLITASLFSGTEFDPETDIDISTVFDSVYSEGDDFRMIIDIDLQKGYHITDSELFFIDIGNFPELKDEGKLLSGREEYDGDSVYKGKVSYLFEGIYPGTDERSVTVGYQICYEEGDDFCFMPVERRIKPDFNNIDPDRSEFLNNGILETQDVEINNYRSDLTIQEKLAAMLEGKSSWSLWVFIITFAGGVLASLTPCVYPIIPVVVSYMGGRSENSKSAGFILSLFFVTGLAITYSVIGLLASFFSDVFGMGDFASNPYVRSFIAVIFLVLALSMFGFWDMNILSSDKQTRLMDKGKSKKGVIGALMIGMVSGLVAAPCVGPVLAMLLIHVANAGNVLYGSMLFMTFAFGMGMLFLVIGTFSGAISALPSSGMWMVKIKKVFGIIMIGASLYFIRIVLPVWLFFFIVSILLIMLSVFFGGFSRVDTKSAGIFEYTGKSLGIFVFIVALVFSLKTISVFTELPFAGNPVSTLDERYAGIKFEKTNSDTNIVDRAVGRIGGTNKLVMVDLWAEWCSNCLELDKKTWSDPQVADFVQNNFIPLKLDFTKKDSDFSRNFIEKFKDHGATNLPLILFIDHEGKVVDKMLGFIDADRMLDRLKNIKEKNK